MKITRTLVAMIFLGFMASMPISSEPYRVSTDYEWAVQGYLSGSSVWSHWSCEGLVSVLTIVQFTSDPSSCLGVSGVYIKYAFPLAFPCLIAIGLLIALKKVGFFYLKP